MNHTQQNSLRELSEYLPEGTEDIALRWREDLAFDLKLTRPRKSKLGDPLELLRLMTSMGAICFDMSSTHHELYRPSISLSLGTVLP